MKKIREKFLLVLIVFSLFSVTMSINATNTAVVQNTTSDPLDADIEAKMNIGAWIIVGGDRSDHHLRNIIRSGCEKAYDALISCGYTAANIYYMYPNTIWSWPAKADNRTTEDGIKYAIETWAHNKLVGTNKALGIYLFSHGGTGYMCLQGTDPGHNLWDTELNTMLNNLESTSGCDRMFVLYAACHAGSFINPVSKSDRIVVTTTSSALSSYVNPAGDWELFSETFFSSITSCDTIGEAFEDAEANIHAVGYGSWQKPWIDDDHNEVGHEVDAAGNLPNGGDGTDALNTRLCCPSIIIIEPIILIKWWPIKWWWKNDPKYLMRRDVWCSVENTTPVEQVVMRVTPPGWDPFGYNTTDEGEQGPAMALGEDEGVWKTTLTDPDGDGNFTGYLSLPPLPGMGNELPDGDFGVSYYARGDDGSVARIVETEIGLNPTGTPPADTTDPVVEITNPADAAEVSGTVNITAEGNDDEALEKIEIYVDGVLKHTETMPETYPYPEAEYSWDASGQTGTHNITAKAIDKAGNDATETISVTLPAAEEGIPGFETHIVIIGCFLVVVAVYILNKKREPIVSF